MFSQWLPREPGHAQFPEAKSKYHPTHTVLHGRPLGMLTDWEKAQFFQMGAFLQSESRIFEMLNYFKSVNTNSGGLLSGEDIQQLF